MDHSIQTLAGAHHGEVLSLDWNKYAENIICTGGSDQLVKVWDIRAPSRELSVLQGHEFGVRRVKFSPHEENIIASVGYDMTMRIWDTTRPPQASMVHVYDAHTEFVVGFDWSLYHRGAWATCAWDENVHVCIP